MGNLSCVSCSSAAVKINRVRVMKPNGETLEYEVRQPLKAAEVMLEHPQHVLVKADAIKAAAAGGGGGGRCRSHSSSSSSRRSSSSITASAAAHPLRADDDLRVGSLYLLLPMDSVQFQHVQRQGAQPSPSSLGISFRSSSGAILARRKSGARAVGEDSMAMMMVIQRSRSCSWSYWRPTLQPISEIGLLA